MTQTFQELTCNLKSKVRHETLDGREYLVCPAVLLTHGVHKGSNGDIYYSDIELANIPSRWDHKPIVIYHPQKNGNYSTACEPAVLESRGCGMLLNTHFDDKLRTEAWFDKEKTTKVDKRVIVALESETMMEASAGLFSDIVLGKGTYAGKDYVGSACNFAPDHYAILPDKIGACSIKDGGGLLQTNEAQDQIAALTAIVAEQAETINRLQTSKEPSVDKKVLIDYIITANVGYDETDRPGFETMKDAKLQSIHDFVKKTKDTPTPAVVQPVVNEVKPPVSLPTPAPRPQLTLNEYLDNAPPELRGVLMEGVMSANAEKARHIQSISTYKHNRFTPEYLNGQPLEVLRNMAAMVAPSVTFPNYAGAATLPTVNQEVEQAPLADIQIDWNK